MKVDWRKLNAYFYFVLLFFFYFRLASLPRVALQGECQIKKGNTCNVKFRKCRIRDCVLSKTPEKCTIKECEWWLSFRKCRIKECEFRSIGLFFALLSSLKVNEGHLVILEIFL